MVNLALHRGKTISATQEPQARQGRLDEGESPRARGTSAYLLLVPRNKAANV